MPEEPMDLEPIEIEPTDEEMTPPPLPTALDDVLDFDEPEPVAPPPLDPEPVSFGVSEPEPAMTIPDPFAEPASPPPAATAMPSAAPEKKNNSTLIIVLVVIAVLLLCCCCTVVGVFALYSGDIAYELGLNLVSGLQMLLM